jgi:hypothetical protein
MGKIYKVTNQYALDASNRMSTFKKAGTYHQDDEEQEEDVGDLVELEPQVLGYEALPSSSCSSTSFSPASP